MNDKAYYYLYKITSLIPSKPYYYLGKHSTNDIEDSYFGSGTRLIRTLKKYGRKISKKKFWGFMIQKKNCARQKET